MPPCALENLLPVVADTAMFEPEVVYCGGGTTATMLKVRSDDLRRMLGPLVARDILGGGAETYGFLMAAAGVGSLISALALAFGGRATLGRVFIGSQGRTARRVAGLLQHA